MSNAPTALEIAQLELGESMVPYPDEFLEDYSPGAAFLFLRQCAMVALKIATGAAASLMDEGEETQPIASEVLNGAAACVAGATHMLVALGVLPPEAEDALTGASDATT